MSDIYHSWAELSRAESQGVDYAVNYEQRGSAWLVSAPHGGGIEPGTTEIARAIASTDLSFYSVDGVKTSGNSILHITSHNFDEPGFLNAASQHDRILAVHGCRNSERTADVAVWVGGRDELIVSRAIECLSAEGYGAAADFYTPGKDLANLCNRGKLGAGLQLELSEALRSTFFLSLRASGRRTARPALSHFADCVRTILALPNTR
jgi:phage replication-related protein YjqB (UPF0714/DUF867 family)